MSIFKNKSHVEVVHFAPPADLKEDDIKYYFVGYHWTDGQGYGFGNTYFEAIDFLDIDKAERIIAETRNIPIPVILTMNEITKEQYTKAVK